MSALLLTVSVNMVKVEALASSCRQELDGTWQSSASSEAGAWNLPFLKSCRFPWELPKAEQHAQGGGRKDRF